LKGPLYADAGEAWALLLRYRAQIEDWFSDIALELVVAEHDGLAFVRRQRDEGEAGGDGAREDRAAPLPELVARRELPYKLSLLCVLLVEELYRFEASASDESRLVLGRARIRELVLPYLPRKTNEAKQFDDIDRQVSKLEDYGFLRRLSADSDEYEVTKLLKYKIDAAILAESLERLKSYAQDAAGEKGNADE
jgi:hypothetical protein